MLDARLRRDTVTEDDIRRVARKIAAFHAGAETSPDITRLGGLSTVRHNVEENFAQTERYVGNLVTKEAFEDVAAYSRAFVNAQGTLFASREASGRIRDCHGDLHALQICLVNDIDFIDCIEFNPLYRYSDVASDVAFLTMDLDCHGRDDLSRVLWDSYAEASGDREAHALARFYQSYRAYVRAKVNIFRLDTAVLAAEEREQTRREASSYYELSHRYALEVLPQPALYLMAGLVGTGKSAVAGELSCRWGLTVLSSDVERKRLAGLGATEHRYVPYGTDIYSPSFDQATYQKLLEGASKALEAGASVVLDASLPSG